VPVDGGNETQEVDGRNLADAFTFTVAASGIYFAGPRDVASGTVPLSLYRFADEKTTELARFDLPFRLHLSVSPDEKWLYYARLDSSVDDLMLVENFR
jgi:hypothetical protein